MMPAQSVSKLLSADSDYTNNRNLLKKIILTTYLGRLRINGLAPDENYSLSEYLFDEEQIIFDYTRLSAQQKEKFQAWLLADHQEDKIYSDLSSQTVNEYRGFTAQVSRNWWGRLKVFFGVSDTELWQLADRTLSLEYQLTSLTMCHGKHGSLIGFNQLFIPQVGAKYYDPIFPKLKPLGNTKRVFITDNLVDLLAQQNMDSETITEYLDKPHPQAIPVPDLEQRFTDMYNYRNMQKFTVLRPWYWRIWEWFLSWFPQPKERNNAKNWELLLENEKVKVFQDAASEEVLVTEIKPEIENLVFCGGGPKIFGHVGVWKALTEAQIRPKRFAGSSAGAIMALLCYLGYTAEEVENFFNSLQQEHIVYFELDRNGISDAKSLKTAMDFVLAQKLYEITSVHNIPYPQGKITFAVLESVRQQCLEKGVDCGLGERLIITTTKRSDGSAKYYSYDLEPDEEVTEIVKISASLPIMYRPTIVDGEVHTDGSLSSNLPTEVFTDDYSTFLESEFGANLKVMAVQFDTGSERDALTGNITQVYRENIILNFIYSLMSGVSDPASAWEQDRLKLRKYAAQSVIVDMIEAPSSFEVSTEQRQKMAETGYKAAKEYIDLRYCKKKDGSYKNDVLMYTSFNSMVDLLSYCCYRGDITWFNRINDKIIESHLPNKAGLIKKTLELRSLYFENCTSSEIEKIETNETSPTFFGNPVPVQAVNDSIDQFPQILIILYPIFLKISSNLIKEKSEQNKFDLAHHAISIQSPLSCLEHLTQIHGEMHVLLFIIINLLKSLREETSDEVVKNLKSIQIYLETKSQNILKPEFYSLWNLNARQCMRIFKMMQKGKLYDAAILCSIISHAQAEPLPSPDEIASANDFVEGEDLWYLFPILLRLCASLTKNKSDKAKIELAIINQSVTTPLAFADFFTNKINATHHILISSIVNAVLQLDEQPGPKHYLKFNQFMNFFYANELDLSNPEFYGAWNLSRQQSYRVMQFFVEGQIDQAIRFCTILSQEHAEPLQLIEEEQFTNDLSADESGLSHSL